MRITVHVYFAGVSLLLFRAFHLSKWRDTRWRLTFLREIISRSVDSRFLYNLGKEEDADPSKEILSKLERAVKSIQYVDYFTRVWDKQR